jgi:superfamily II DNA or RNA helicase
MAQADAANSAREWLTLNWARPNEELVRRAKREIERTWLPDYPFLKTLVIELMEYGLGPMGRPQSRAEHLAYVARCRNTANFRRILARHMKMHGEDWSEAEVGSSVPRGRVVLDPSKQPLDPRKPFPYQVEAWNSLSACSARRDSTGGFPGLLVMPTGSGKTYTAAHWLMENVVARGGRVMWVAHREALLEQAQEWFIRLASLAHNPAREDPLVIRIVSGSYCVVSQLTPDDDIMLCSVASLARHKAVVEDILSDPSIFLVIDEAHHTPARSYRDIIKYMKQLKHNKLLGLTATPTRMIESERAVLSQLFNNNIVYQVEFRDLVECDYLARPSKIRVTTDVDAEAGMTEEERRHVARFDTLSEETLGRLGSMNRRNDIIVDHYLENEAKYGKTLVFATCIDHAYLLRDKFRARGVNAEYVASRRPDGENIDEGEVLSKFRSFNSGLDVLINVQKMTEGTDLPSVETVFLARPTNSAVLMQQMVGRALRGPRVGGTPQAYLVSFEDHWEQFTDFERPFDLISELVDPFEEVALDIMEADEDIVDRVLDVVPHELWRAVSAALSRLPRSFDRAQVFEAVPCGWYVLARSVPMGDDVMQIIPVHNHDKPCWDALVGYLKTLTPSQAESLNPEEAYEEFFGDCDIPRPAEGLVEQMIAHRAADGEEPEWQDFEARSRIDPAEVAREIVEANYGPRESQAIVEERYSSALAQAVYPDLREFKMAVDEAVWDLMNPDQAVRVPLGIPVFEPRPDEMMAPGPAHDLRDILHSMLVAGASILGVSELEEEGIEIVWTKRLIKRWYAMAHYDHMGEYGEGLIRVNMLLDSPDVSREAMEFLLWHEFLHLWLKQGHTREFRRLEMKWPTFVQRNRELDTIGERYGVSFW